MSTSLLRKCPALLFATALLAAPQASAVTYLDDCANNGVLLSSNYELGFYDPLGTPPASRTATSGSFPPGSPPPAGFDNAASANLNVLVVNPTSSGSTATTPSPLVMTPFMGAPKDRVELVQELKLEFGTPSGTTPTDEFIFRAEGMASAVGAQLISGNPARARVLVTHVVDFYNDLVPAGGPAPSCFGVLNLPSMPALAPYETIRELEVVKTPSTSPTVELVQSSGDGPASFTLTPGTEYSIIYQYEYDVPHGIDPPFNGTYTVTTSPPSPAPAVPTTSALPGFVLLLALAGTGGLMLSVLRSRSSFTG